MELTELLVALLAGVVQGIVEWLPVSSQGNLAMVLTLVGISPAIALQLALFIQIGTTVSAAYYYRDDILEAARDLPDWTPQKAFSGGNAITTFIALACLATGAVGIPLYIYAVDLASEVTGGVFIAAIGVLLIITGVLQLASEAVSLGTKETPTLLDALIVGGAQGFAILPGVSRSGITVSALLFRSYEAPAALRLSFLLSIPASLSGGALTVLEAGGLPGVSPLAAAVALVTSAAVGYLTIGGLMKLFERIPFWVVCFGLGALATAGGVLVTILEV